MNTTPTILRTLNHPEETGERLSDAWRLFLQDIHRMAKDRAARQKTATMASTNDGQPETN